MLVGSCAGRDPTGVEDGILIPIVPEDPAPRIEVSPEPPQTCEVDPDGALGLSARPANTTCLAPARRVTGGALDVVDRWPGLVFDAPVFLLEEPGTDEMVVLQRNGRILRFHKNDTGATQADPWLDISDHTRSSEDNGEAGALGMAFHPAWPQDDRFFLYYLARSSGPQPYVDRLSVFRTDSDGTLDESSEEVLLEVDDYAVQHNGGMLGFGPDGRLYLSIGDGGQEDDPFENAQNLSVLLGKMVRIDVDHGGPNAPYGVPASNPFVGVAGARPEIYAYGFRNPWRWSFDRGTGQMWLGDVGSQTWEEIDVVEAGGNFGWDVFEGPSCFVDTTGPSGDCSAGGFVEPVLAYQHLQGTNVVIGGYVYRGTEMPSMVGTYVFGDFSSGGLFTIGYDNDGVAQRVAAYDGTHHVSSLAEDEDGELYVLDHQSGTVRQIVEAGDAPPDTFPKTLKETGCVEADDAKQVASGVVPYTVNQPLWSDGAVKQRFMALPDGAQATVLSSGDIDFPVGTVLMKTFAVGGRRVETRLLIHHDDGDWGGYSYEWSDSEDDALLLPPAGKSKRLPNGQTWVYPSSSACMLCHTQASGRALGLETRQLDGGFPYRQGRCSNQLDTLESIGMVAPFDRPPLAPFANLLDEHATPEQKARAYLHVNCAICHQPGGGARGELDMRAEVPLHDTQVCDLPPLDGDFGVDDARLLAPGDPARSLISLRMKRLGAGRMPQVGSLLVDDAAVDIIDSFITSTTAQSCDAP